MPLTGMSWLLQFKVNLSLNPEQCFNNGSESIILNQLIN